MSLVRFVLFLSALISTAIAAVELLTGMDCYVALISAVAALGGWVLMDVLEAEHNRRIREERADVWQRREREGFGL